MSEPWIRVHANLHAKPVVFRAMESLGVRKAEAIGLLVTFWGSVSQHVVNGNIKDATDLQLEEWAGWNGKRGRFAAFVRAKHLDEDSRVNEWDEYHGKLEDRREKDRRRKAERRRTSSGHPADAPQDSRTDSLPTRANETIRNETTTSTTLPAGAEKGWQPVREKRIADRLTTTAGREAFAALLHGQQGAVGKTAICGEVETWLDGGGGQTCTAEQMDTALRDYVGKYLEPQGWQPALFRACVTRVKRTPGEPPPTTPGGGDALDQLAADWKAKERVAHA